MHKRALCDTSSQSALSQFIECWREKVDPVEGRADVSSGLP